TGRCQEPRPAKPVPAANHRRAGPATDRCRAASRTVGVRRLSTFLILLAFSAASARAGGTPIGFVSLPDRGQLAIIGLPGGGALGTLSLPGRPSTVTASMNGRRLIAVSPDAGAVSQIDGVRQVAVRIYHGFAR